MIKLTDINSLTHHVAAENICRISETGPSSQWHGIRSIVKLFDGQTIECQESAQTVADRVTGSSSPPRGAADMTPIDLVLATQIK